VKVGVRAKAASKAGTGDREKRPRRVTVKRGKPQDT
jgi:hypothetical protein